MWTRIYSDPSMDHLKPLLRPDWMQCDVFACKVLEVWAYCGPSDFMEVLACHQESSFDILLVSKVAAIIRRCSTLSQIIFINIIMLMLLFVLPPNRVSPMTLPSKISPLTGGEQGDLGELPEFGRCFAKCLPSCLTATTSRGTKRDWMGITCC